MASRARSVAARSLTGHGGTHSDLAVADAVKTVIDLLGRLNRKERFFLVAQALGNPHFTPDPAFLDAIGEECDVTFPGPDQVHCFIDFTSTGSMPRSSWRTRMALDRSRAPLSLLPPQPLRLGT